MSPGTTRPFRVATFANTCSATLIAFVPLRFAIAIVTAGSSSPVPMAGAVREGLATPVGVPAEPPEASARREARPPPNST